MTRATKQPGVFAPASVPMLNSLELKALRELSWVDLSVEIIKLFAPSLAKKEVLKAALQAVANKSLHPAVIPLEQIGRHTWLAQGYMWPTQSDSHCAMELLRALIDMIGGKPAGFVGATTGDSGAAAIYALADKAPVITVFPHERLDEYRRRGLTTCDKQNSYVFAVDGDIDAAFETSRRLAADFGLVSYDQQNIIHVIAQIIEVFYTALSAGAPEREVVFAYTDPNASLATAALIARKMGLPVRFTLAVGGLWDEFSSRATLPSTRDRPSRPLRPVNLERLVFVASGNDITLTNQFFESPYIPLDPGVFKAIRPHLKGVRVSLENARKTMQEAYRSSGVILDLNAAEALEAARSHVIDGTSMVVVQHAHGLNNPAIFREVTGASPVLPQYTAALEAADRPERLVLARDYKTLCEHISKIMGR